MPTTDLGGAVQPGGPFFRLAGRRGQAFIPFGGGVPISVNAQLVGAAGVAGGTPDRDHEMAAAAVAALTTGV